MKILVVDDERELGVLLGLALRRLGHTPLLACDPLDALHMATPDVDAVISDIDMPNMNGVELARRLRETRESLPIAFCTGSDLGDELAVAATSFGRVLPKATRPEQVRAVLAALTDEPVALREQPRIRTRLTLTYCTGSQLVWDRVENASQGGLFIRGAFDLEPGQALEVDIDLPGQGVFRLPVEVRYVLTPAQAALADRQPGVGVRVLDDRRADPLRYYLHRLERRPHFAVFTNDPHSRELFEQAGYQVHPAPAPVELTPAVARCIAPVVGVLVSPADRPAYENAARVAGLGDIVYGVSSIDDREAAMVALDHAL